jgi:hypothetical protein
MWSYAASLPLFVPANTAGEVWVRVRVEVRQGEAGIGVLDRSETAFQDRAFVSARAEERTIFLRITNPREAQSLIIENSSPDGSPAEILLREVKVLAEPVVKGSEPVRIAERV